MSLFNLTHKSVVLKFGECAKPQFDPTATYIFRLTGVDGMGFLEIQEVRLGADGLHETTGDPFWINKDLVLAIHEFSESKVFENLRFSGPPVVTKAARTARMKAGPKSKASAAQAEG